MPKLKITLKPATDPLAISRKVTVTIDGVSTTQTISPSATELDLIPLLPGQTPHVLVQDFSEHGCPGKPIASELPEPVAPSQPEAATLEILADTPARVAVDSSGPVAEIIADPAGTTPAPMPSDPPAAPHYLV